MFKSCTDCDKPYREGGEQVEGESKQDKIERTVDDTVQYAKPNKEPRSIYIYRIHLICDEKVKYEQIEKDWNLEQILEVVRWIRYLWW